MSFPNFNFPPFSRLGQFPDEPLHSRDPFCRRCDDVEDVPYEDITDEAKEKSKIGKDARRRQIFDAAMKRSEDILKESPVSGLFLLSVFTLGAKWADENPISGYKSREEWVIAQGVKVEEVLKEAEVKSGKSGKGDFLLSLAIFSIFRDGANWANENPFSTL